MGTDFQDLNQKFLRSFFSILFLLTQLIIIPNIVVTGSIKDDISASIFVYPEEPSEVDEIRIEFYSNLNNLALISEIQVVLEYKHTNTELYSTNTSIMELKLEDNTTAGLFEAFIGPFEKGTLRYNISIQKEIEIIYSSNGHEIIVKKLTGLKIKNIARKPDIITTKDAVRITATIFGENVKADSVLLHYKPSVVFYSVIMTHVAQSMNMYEITIGPFNEPTTVDYYITVENTSNQVFQSSDNYFIVKPSETSTSTTTRPIPSFSLILVLISLGILLMLKKGSKWNHSP